VIFSRNKLFVLKKERTNSVLLCRGDLDDEADDLTDLLARVLELSFLPEVSDALKVLDELRAVAEDVDSLTSNDLENLSVADVLDDLADGLLEVLETAGRHRVGDLLNAAGKLGKSTADGADADTLDAVEEVLPGSVKVADDAVDVLGAEGRIAHRAAQALSNTANKGVDVSRSDLGAVEAVVVDEDGKDLTGVLTESVVVAGLEAAVEGLEEVDKLTTVAVDVHNLVLDEGLDVAAADLSDNADDVLGRLDHATVLEGSSELLNTVSKVHEALSDLRNAESADAMTNELGTLLKVGGKVLHVTDAGRGIAHDNVKAIGKALNKVENVSLTVETTSGDTSLKGTRRKIKHTTGLTHLSLQQEALVDGRRRDNKNKKEKRNGGSAHLREKTKEKKETC